MEDKAVPVSLRDVLFDELLQALLNGNELRIGMNHDGCNDHEGFSPRCSSFVHESQAHEPMTLRGSRPESEDPSRHDRFLPVSLITHH